MNPGAEKVALSGTPEPAGSLRPSESLVVLTTRCMLKCQSLICLAMTAPVTSAMLLLEFLRLEATLRYSTR